MSDAGVLPRFGGPSGFMFEIEDWCGTKPPRRFPPKKGQFRDMLFAVAIASFAEQVTDEKVRVGLQGMANDLFVAGARGIAG